MKKNYSGYHKPNSKKFGVFRGGGINYWKRISRDAKSLFMPYSDGTYVQMNGILTQITENMSKDENPQYTWGVDPPSLENAAKRIEFVINKSISDSVWGMDVISPENAAKP